MTEHTTDATESADQTTTTDVTDAPSTSAGDGAVADGERGSSPEPGAAAPVAGTATATDGAPDRGLDDATAADRASSGDEARAVVPSGGAPAAEPDLPEVTGHSTEDAPVADGAPAQPDDAVGEADGSGTTPDPGGDTTPAEVPVGEVGEPVAVADAGSAAAGTTVGPSDDAAVPGPPADGAPAELEHEAQAPAAEPVADATPEVGPGADAESAVDAAPGVEPDAEAAVDAAPEVEPGATGAVDAAPEVEPDAEVAVDAAPESEPAAGAAVDAAPESEPAAETAVDAVPAPEVEVAIDAVPESEPEAEAAADATPAEPQADSAPAPDVAAPADQGTAPAQAAPEDGSTAPTARPMPRPTPRPVPRPMPRTPQGPAPAAGPRAPAAPVAPPQDAAEALHAATFGRVDEEGTVYVREGDGERAVGQFPGASAEEALALYVRRYLDLQAKVVLLETRLAATDMAPKEAEQTLGKLTEELAEPAAVGDLAGLRGRLEALRGVAAERRAAAEAERAAAKEAAVAARTAIVEQAEKIAATDPERIQWRPAGEQLRVLLDQWKDAQRNGPRIDRPTEESLWKRFSHARTTFDRERRHFFAELEARNASARSAKEGLVAQAEKLATSTDWGATAGAYRDLMAQWKASGRASRKEDDALWARFRAAQDAFFSARDAASAETDAEFRANLEVKEALLVEAERLLPITDLAAAKAALRSIQDRWDAAGKVPRGDLQRVEGRLRAVETAIRDADQSAWSRGNPETKARAEGAAAQLEAAIAGLEADLAKAQAAGNARKIADAQAALDARRAWLEQVRRAAQGS